MKRNNKKEIIYGINPVLETLKAGKRRIHSLLIIHNKREQLSQILKLAISKGIKIKYMRGKEMSKLFPDREDQGVALEAETYPYSTLDEILHNNTRLPIVIALDRIQDPRNLGAIIRTAEGFNCSGVIIHKYGSCRITPLAVRTSAGMSEHLFVSLVTNLADAIRKFKKEGFKTIGMDMQGEKTIFNEDLTGNLMLILGGEGEGLRPLSLSLCDAVIKIPLSYNCPSLNVSVAAAITIAESFRQRLKKNAVGDAGFEPATSTV